MDQGRQERDNLDTGIMQDVRGQRQTMTWAPCATAYNLGNFLRTLAMPEAIKKAGR